MDRHHPSKRRSNFYKVILCKFNTTFFAKFLGGLLLKVIFTSRFKKIIEWLTGAGFTFLFISLIFQYCTGNVDVVFEKSINNQYEFYLENTTPFDRVIEKFRVHTPPTQKVIFEITKDMYVKKVGNNIIFPEGNDVYVPATEYSELDKKVLPGNSKQKIIVPPLASKRWLKPEAFVASINIVSRPRNYFINIIENILSIFGNKKHLFNQNYVIIDNYWKAVESNDPDEAIKLVCKYYNDKQDECV
ncbi:MAG: hypothetical protein ABI597_00755 [Gammaproteobacteria bacterium]